MTAHQLRRRVQHLGLHRGLGKVGHPQDEAATRLAMHERCRGTQMVCFERLRPRLRKCIEQIRKWATPRPGSTSCCVSRP